MRQRFVVRDDVPAPDGRSKGYSDAMRELKFGESVLLPASVSAVRSLMNKFYLRGERVRYSFRAKSEDAGTRVWRVL